MKSTVSMDDCSGEWKRRWDRDERWRQSWADAAAEVRRFNAEEEAELLAKDAEREAPPPRAGA